MYDDDTLSHFEFEAKPFTTSELTAIFDYRKEIDGIPDTLDGIDPKELVAMRASLGAPGVRALLDECAGCLNTWYLALDKALAELLTCTSESTSYSTAAGRFLDAEAKAYHQSRQAFEHTVTVFLLGRDPSPLVGNYPPITNTLNLAQQTLEGPA